MRPDVTLVDCDRHMTMIRGPTHPAPIHPGEMRLEEFLKPMGLTQQQLADGIRAPYPRVNELINGKRDVTSSIALWLAKFLKNFADRARGELS